ncbi:unnamed protein product [Didymodactylos carnosus]|uniref:Uncharacterized protein n=1 Tax=Didymodactylos carnosus TaxID=1234261 RepID=A0A8S2FHG5_9BILA|nr:unnamed protein product [Didymodactylos carnosus]CAF4249551.1 unnamed protein product [Didymodactylos carnosus]
MGTNSKYPAQCKEVKDKCQQLENNWLKNDSNNARATMVQKFPSPVRPYDPMWVDSPANKPPHNNIPAFPPCPRCNGVKFETEYFTEGGRMNGDGYGAVFNYCTTCGWCKWEKWDDQ